MPGTEVRPRSHVDTPEWQSFEARMLARRAERRAAAARARRARLARIAGVATLLIVAAALGFAVTWIVQQPIAFTAVRPTAPPAIALRANDSVAPLPPTDESLVPILFTPSEFEADAGVTGTAGSTAAGGPAASTGPVHPPPAAPVSDAPRDGVRREAPLSMPRPSTETERAEPPAAPVTIVPGTREDGAPAPVAATTSRPAEIGDRPPEADRVTPAPRVDAPSRPASLATEMDGRASASADAVLPAPDARAAVRNVLERYRLAYERLDAAAAGAVWPAVDRRALARAFDSLQSQQINFRDCRILTGGATAHATCTGRARAVPKIGSGGASEADRTWEFSLVQKGNDWQIARATVR